VGAQITDISAVADENFDISLLGNASIWLVVTISLHNVLIIPE
jgi:hypothetical protein